MTGLRYRLSVTPSPTASKACRSLPLSYGEQLAHLLLDGRIYQVCEFGLQMNCLKHCGTPGSTGIEGQLVQLQQYWCGQALPVWTDSLLCVLQHFTAMFSFCRYICESVFSNIEGSVQAVNTA